MEGKSRQQQQGRVTVNGQDTSLTSHQVGTQYNRYDRHDDAETTAYVPVYNYSIRHAGLRKLVPMPSITIVALEARLIAMYLSTLLPCLYCSNIQQAVTKLISSKNESRMRGML